MSATHFTVGTSYTVGKSCKQTPPASFVVQARSAHSRKSTEIRQAMDGQVCGGGGGAGLRAWGGGYS